MALGRQIATLGTAAVVALALNACGGNSPQGPKIPKEVSDALIAKLDTVEQNIDAEDCTGDTGSAPSSLSSLREGFEAAAKEGKISSEIASEGRQLLDRLQTQVSDFCAAQLQADEKSTTTSATTTSTTTTTEPDTTEHKPSKDQTKPEETTQTTTTKPETTTTQSTTPPGQGPDGNGPPGQDGGFTTDDGGFAPGRAGGAPEGGGK